MNLRSKNRISADFNMSSMTDIVFLLLIFFMLTSSFVTPTALPVSLPTSQSAPIVLQKISVTVTADLDYYVNDKPTTIEQMRTELAGLLQDADEGVVVLNIDKSVPVEHLVKVATIANELNAKVSIATAQSE